MLEAGRKGACDPGDGEIESKRKPRIHPQPPTSASSTHTRSPINAQIFSLGALQRCSSTPSSLPPSWPLSLRKKRTYLTTPRCLPVRAAATFFSALSSIACGITLPTYLEHWHACARLLSCIFFTSETTHAHLSATPKRATRFTSTTTTCVNGKLLSSQILAHQLRPH